jgi:hypothetical protein
VAVAAAERKETATFLRAILGLTSRCMVNVGIKKSISEKFIGAVYVIVTFYDYVKT